MTIKEKIILDWIYQNTSIKDSIDVNTNIIESRIVSSKMLIELILFIENTSGKEILEEELKPDSFINVKTIAEKFF